VVRGSGRSTEQETADDSRRPPGSFGVIDVAILIPQHDDEGRSATILPGVPLPEWALPSGPIAPEPDPAEAAAVEATAGAAAPPAPPTAPPAPDAAPSGPPLEAPALVLAGATLLDAPPAEAAPVSPYAPPLPLGTNGPGPMRAGWDYPGSDFRELAHDEAVAEAAEAALVEETEAQAASASALDPAPALAMTAPVPVLEPLAAPEAPVAAAPAGPAAAVEIVAPADEVASDVDPADGPHDGDDEQDASPASRRPLALLAVVGGVAIAGAVAAFVWPGFLVAAEPAPVPVVPPVSAPAAAAPVELTTPASVGQYTKLTGAPAEALTTAVGTSALPGLSAPVSAVYGTGTTPAVTVIAWKAASPLGASAIPSAYAGFQGATAAVVTDITTTPVAGGEMQCGTTVVSGTPASLCFWSDASSFGSVTVLRPSSPESASDTAVAVRSAVVGG
jgi:hypothetical protein